MTHTQLLQLVDYYADLEIRVQRLMKQACRPVCASCLKICCRPEMCRESLESPFLVLAKERGETKPTWSEERGLLGPKGCALSVGRPPVCYEFLCQAILENQPNQAARLKLKDLAMVLTRAGQRALGSDHIVEIMTMERLAQVKPPRLAAHFALAEAELIEFESFWSQPSRSR